MRKGRVWEWLTQPIEVMKRNLVTTAVLLFNYSPMAGGGSEHSIPMYMGLGDGGEA